MLLVAPPKMKSRIRECPYAPMTRRSALRDVTYDVEDLTDTATSSVDAVQDDVYTMSAPNALRAPRRTAWNQ